MLYVFSSIYKMEGVGQRRKEEKGTSGQIMCHFIMLFFFNLEDTEREIPL